MIRIPYIAGSFDTQTARRMQLRRAVRTRPLGQSGMSGRDYFFFGLMCHRLLASSCPSVPLVTAKMSPLPSVAT